MNRLLICCACFLWLLPFAQAQRLPDAVVPESYTLQLTPDLTKETFTGDETIHVRILKPTSQIVLNATDIDFQHVSIMSGNSQQDATVTLDKDKQQATLAVKELLPPGSATLQISYNGILNHDLRGFYVGRQDHNQKYAATQLEATDARRAFPCFDEPAYKATFQVTIVADKGLSVISNTKALSDVPGPGEAKHTVRFERTAKMSSYLVAFVVGKFDFIEGSADGIPIRVFTSPGKKELAKFALDTAEHALPYYDHYFGMRYPFGKLDMVALPDFGPGAMENTGCITFREAYILLDEKHSDLENRKFLASVITHEMAHQWFGDLVTMKWWDDIWLNEGFASWMSSKPIEAWHPEWHVELNDVNDATRALGLDSLENTHPIRQEAETPAEILELADVITYDKTAAVLRMVESYLGEETFRAGVNDYIKAHAYGNATATDFWEALTRVSHKPVDRIMKSFIDQPGPPIVSVKAECKASKETVTLTEQRYFFDREKFQAGNDELWQIPVCMKDETGHSAARCELLTQREQTVTLPACSSWLDVNAGSRGYYYSGYDPEVVRALAKDAEQKLSPAERIMLLGDVWAAVRVDREKIGDYLTLAEGVASDRTPQVVRKLVTQLAFIDDYLVTDADRQAYQSWVDTTFSPLAKDLGWEQRSGDDEATETLRGELLQVLAGVAHDPNAEAVARKIADQYLSDPSSVDDALASVALPLAAQNGDENFYNNIMEHLQHATAPEQKNLYIRTLLSFHDPKLLERTLHFAVSGARSQDATLIIARLIANPAGRKLGWDFVRDQWDSMKGDNGAFGGGSAAMIVASTRNFCDAEMRDQVQSFFSTHPVPAASRTLKQSLEQIGYCIDMKGQQGTDLANWLQNAGGHAGK